MFVKHILYINIINVNSMLLYNMNVNHYSVLVIYMKNKRVKKIGLIVLIGLMASLCVIPSIRAEDITLDGKVSETVWVDWFEDPGYPSYSGYYTVDEEAVYIGIVLDIDNVDDANLRFAFRAEASDYLIKITEEGDMSFYPGDSSRTAWWGGKRIGLPYGVEVVQGETSGKASYEIKLLKEILGDYADPSEDFPLLVMSKATDSSVPNHYPDNRGDWWFYRDGDTEVIWAEEPPTFHAPEFPLGTLSSIAVMALAFVLASRKKNTINLP